MWFKADLRKLPARCNVSILVQMINCKDKLHVSWGDLNIGNLTMLKNYYYILHGIMILGSCF